MGVGNRCCERIISLCKINKKKRRKSKLLSLLLFFFFFLILCDCAQIFIGKSIKQ